MKLQLVSFAGLALAAGAPAEAAPAAKPAAKPAEVDGVTVTGTSAKGIQLQTDRRSYGVADDLRAATGSVADALGSIPSVAVDSQGVITLRGDPNVVVMIDGKPSSLFKGPGGGQALQAMSADQIERIEVLANPSAASSSDGSGGIINLITKANRKPGRTGSVSANLGADGRYSGALSGSYSAGKLTASANLTARQDRVSSVSEEDRTNLGGSNPVTSHIDGRQANEINSQNLRLGADYDLDPRNRISGEVRGFALNWSATRNERFVQGDSAPLAYERAGDLDIKRRNLAASATWRRQFSGTDHTLVVNLSRERTTDDRGRRYGLLFTAPVAATAFEDYEWAGVQDQSRLKADYVRPMPGGGALKVGYDLQIDDNRYDDVGITGATPAAAAIDPALTNLFLYKQTVHAGYGTYERPIGNLTVLAGLRVEQARREVLQVTNRIGDTMEGAGAYPSLHLTYRLNDEQKLVFSYARRIQRPNPLFLNPFVIQQEPTSARAGNLHLKPQRTQSYEAGYQYKKGGTVYAATLYYRQNRNEVTDVVTAFGDGVFLVSRANLTQSRSTGLELIASGKFGKQLTYSFSSNIYRTQIDGLDSAAADAQSGWATSGRASLTWKPTAKDVLQASAVVSGKQFLPQGVQWVGGVLNLGYRHTFNSRLAGVVTVQDALGTSTERLRLDSRQVKARSNTDVDVRAAFIGLSYTFGGGGKAAKEPAFDFGAPAS